MPQDRELMQDDHVGADVQAARQGWASADVVQCVGCYYWFRMGDYGNVCNYPLVKNQLRPCAPRDCYKHENTPYTSTAEALAAYRQEREQRAGLKQIPAGWYKQA